MAECKPWDIKCQAVNTVQEKVSEFADSQFGQAAKAMMEGYDGLLKDFMTSWIGKGVLVDLNGPALTWFHQSLSVVNVLLLSTGLIFAGAKTMLDSRNAGSIKEAAHNLVRVMIVSSVGTSFVSMMIVGGDAYGKWILGQAGVDAKSFGVATAIAASSPGVALLVGLFGILAVVLQWGIMLVRGAILPLLIAFWPTTASALMFKNGGQAFEKVTGWLIAFVLYSPIAASIYALAWKLKSGGDGVGGVITGFMLVVLAVLALPALMRLVAPVSSMVGSAVGGAMAGAAAGAVVGTAVAAGSAVVSGGAGAAGAAGALGGKGKSPGPGPSGGDSGADSGGGSSPSGSAMGAIGGSSSSGGGGGGSVSGPASGSQTPSGGGPGGSASQSGGGSDSGGGSQPAEAGSGGASGGAASGSETHPSSGSSSSGSMSSRRRAFLGAAERAGEEFQESLKNTSNTAEGSITDG